MLESFYRDFWSALSVYYFLIVSIPCMSMFPSRFKTNKRNRWVAIVAGILLACATNYLLEHFMNLAHSWTGLRGSYLEGQILYLISTMLAVTLLYKGNFYAMFTTVILAYCVASHTGFIYGPAMLLLWNDTFTPGMVILRDILGYGSFALYYLALSRFSNVTSFYLSRKDHILLVCMVLAYYVFTCWCQAYFFADTVAILLFNCCTTLVTVIITFLLFRFTREHQRTVEQHFLIQDLKLSESILAQMEENASQIREIKHELGNYAVYISQLLKRKDYDTLSKYVQAIDPWNTDVTEPIATGNGVCNSIVNQKLSYARSLGIAAEATILLPEKMPLDDLTLCSLLGNMLSNAIEACKDHENAFLRLKIYPAKDYLVFRTDNSVSEDILEKNPHLLSTKEDAENHGIGMRVMRRIADRHNGMLHYEMSESNCFTVQVLVHLSEHH